MSHSQLKINNQVIALVLFMFFNLTSCNCGSKDNQDPPSPKTSNDTNTGGKANPGGTNTGGTKTAQQNTGTENTTQANTKTENTAQANTEGANTEAENTEGANTEAENTEGANTEGANTGAENTEGANTGAEKTAIKNPRKQTNPEANSKRISTLRKSTLRKSTPGTNTGAANSKGKSTLATSTPGTNTGTTRNLGKNTNIKKAKYRKPLYNSRPTTKTKKESLKAEKTRKANITITPQKIDKLLKELNDKENPINKVDRAHLIKFLEKVKANDTTSDGYENMFLLSAIKYNNVSKYNTIDILKLIIGKLKDNDSEDAINTTYKRLTFLQYAAYYDNTDAIDLLLKNGAEKYFQTPRPQPPEYEDIVIDGQIIPEGLSAYDIACRFKRKEAMKKLDPKNFKK